MHDTSPILVASTNAYKIEELQAVAREFGRTLLSPAEVANGRAIPEVDETEDTYYGNALLKARAFSEWSGLPALGDDSGLEVNALGKRPGIHSARYAGVETPHLRKMEFLLDELSAALKDDPHAGREAAFRCSLVLCSRDGTIVSSESMLEGEILEKRQGDGGFGYDPIVYIPSLGRTLAELDFEETCSLGFRAVAARQLFAQLSAG